MRQIFEFSDDEGYVHVLKKKKSIRRRSMHGLPSDLFCRAGNVFHFFLRFECRGVHTYCTFLQINHHNTSTEWHREISSWVKAINDSVTNASPPSRPPSLDVASPRVVVRCPLSTHLLERQTISVCYFFISTQLNIEINPIA